MYAIWKKLQPHLPVGICLVLIGMLLLIPTGFEDAAIYQSADRVTARVLSTNEDRVVDTGLVRSGEQVCTLEILGGRFRQQITQGVNMLTGSLEQDKLFAPGDEALVVVSYQGDTILSVTMIDHNRFPAEAVLALAFVALLILFAGKTGIRAILSFILSILMLWKVLVPLYLKGAEPILVGMGITLLLTLSIITLVYGLDRRALAATLGAGAGLIVTCVTGILATSGFRIHGAVMSYAESLLYSGFMDLNLTRIFMASIFIGASGAVMDLAVDITSAVHEVVLKKPDISAKEAIRSGLAVGRAAMGTMTTTLLLAYSGGYVALLMVFMAQGTPVSHILNYKHVAAEIVHTVVGSFGLVTVAPWTAVTAGYFLTRRTLPAGKVFAFRRKERPAPPSDPLNP